ncbi:MAG: hypothetical protein NVSMB46_02700 [Candidatus Saccharimonadales bacterium]
MTSHAHIITSIVPHVKTKGRYSVFVDQVYSFSLSADALLQQKLVVGQQLSSDDLSSFKLIASVDSAYGRALNLVARRPRSEWELYDYMYRKKFSKEIATTVIERLKSHNYVNDEAFATSWVESRRLLKSMSKRRIIMELRQKHISDDVIKTVMLDDNTKDIDSIKDVIRKKQHRYSDSQKLVQFLAGQGYNYDDIRSALDEINSPED